MRKDADRGWDARLGSVAVDPEILALVLDDIFEASRLPRRKQPDLSDLVLTRYCEYRGLDPDAVQDDATLREVAAALGRVSAMLDLEEYVSANFPGGDLDILAEAACAAQLIERDGRPAFQLLEFVAVVGRAQARRSSDWGPATGYGSDEEVPQDRADDPGFDPALMVAALTGLAVDAVGGEANVFVAGACAFTEFYDYDDDHPVPPEVVPKLKEFLSRLSATTDLIPNLDVPPDPAELPWLALAACEVDLFEVAGRPGFRRDEFVAAMERAKSLRDL